MDEYNTRCVQVPPWCYFAADLPTQEHSKGQRVSACIAKDPINEEGIHQHAHLEQRGISLIYDFHLGSRMKQMSFDMMDGQTDST